MNYPVIFDLSYQDFIKQVKNIYTCCAFMNGEYVGITDEMREKLKSGELIIDQYHDQPLGEVIYVDEKEIQ